MRSLATLTAVLVALATSGAYAQTLNDQMQMQHQMQQQQRAPGYYAPAQTQAPMQPHSVAIDSAGNGAIPELPLTIQSTNGINWVNGGVGDEEKAELKSRGNEFNLHLLLSAPNGEFIGDVMLRVLNAQGAPVLNVDDAGPYVYAQLPAGHYTLEATHMNSESKKINVTVPQKGAANAHITFVER